tara:strand:- start:379 stop:594 length:216 start_codon:yes stop_codon:yes gene_type:complete
MSVHKPALATSSTSSSHLKTIRASSNQLRAVRMDGLPSLPTLDELDSDCEAMLLKRVKRLLASLGVKDAKR